MDLGYRDAMQRREDLKKFLRLEEKAGSFS